MIRIKDFDEFVSRVSGDGFANKVAFRRGTLSLTRNLPQQEKDEILRQRDVVLTVLEEYHHWLNER